MKALLFLWLQSQSFYIKLQQQAIAPVLLEQNGKTWADMGCSVGLLSRLAAKMNFNVTGYDTDFLSIKIAEYLFPKLENLYYLQQDFNDCNIQYDVISATSLLSVMKEKKESLKKLISLLKDQNSALIIIEPTKHLTPYNVYKFMRSQRVFWSYKALMLWALARKNRHLEDDFFKNLTDICITQTDALEGMIQFTYIKHSMQDVKKFV